MVLFQITLHHFFYELISCMERKFYHNRPVIVTFSVVAATADPKRGELTRVSINSFITLTIREEVEGQGLISTLMSQCDFIIIVIGFLTAIIGDLASAFGCTVGLTDAVTSTTFVALGTNTFASKVAAIGDKYADSSICNVTGSNAVNVFLGIGVAWTIAAIAHWVRGSTFVVPAGSLGFSVTIFCIFALFAIGLLVLRRKPALGGGELGGPRPGIKLEFFICPLVSCIR
ncbi:unnamed protein product [Hydatigera taeniaeformis]|uniref:Na_Ca_ex domain-containing protein n=1 Tax=Hydatigena taeniaeformis TaxID=6205 RepID=A0A0R3XA33_HYDTA|nr:unnamed protein product [Hydatigera taeniaeformis]